MATKVKVKPEGEKPQMVAQKEEKVVMSAEGKKGDRKGKGKDRDSGKGWGKGGKKGSKPRGENDYSYDGSYARERTGNAYDYTFDEREKRQKAKLDKLMSNCNITAKVEDSAADGQAQQRSGVDLGAFKGSLKGGKKGDKGGKRGGKRRLEDFEEGWDETQRQQQLTDAPAADLKKPEFDEENWTLTIWDEMGKSCKVMIEEGETAPIVLMTDGGDEKEKKRTIKEVKFIPEAETIKFMCEEHEPWFCSLPSHLKEGMEDLEEKLKLMIKRQDALVNEYRERQREEAERKAREAEEKRQAEAREAEEKRRAAEQQMQMQQRLAQGRPGQQGQPQQGGIWGGAAGSTWGGQGAQPGYMMQGGFQGQNRAPLMGQPGAQQNRAPLGGMNAGAYGQQQMGQMGQRPGGYGQQQGGMWGGQPQRPGPFGGQQMGQMGQRPGAPLGGQGQFGQPGAAQQQQQQRMLQLQQMQMMMGKQGQQQMDGRHARGIRAWRRTLRQLRPAVVDGADVHVPSARAARTEPRRCAVSGDNGGQARLAPGRAARVSIGTRRAGGRPAVLWRSRDAPSRAAADAL